MEKILEDGLLSSDFLMKIHRICQMLKIEPDINLLIVECDTLKEFNELTKKPYSTGAVYVSNLIITQPFRILKAKGVFEETLLHEVLHHLIQKNFNLPEWLEEGFILYILGTKPNEISGKSRLYLQRFLSEVRYEEIPDLFDRYRILSSNGNN
ncbi:hypothetical protein [Pseudothermotoga thermarum]|uniref:DUF955 domain-containing protein n=1 Tax=Pseudothermotoga thermarum DSM 5069 TaxID=688269 RepID=F7YWB4_9THEM|nr:hypothetical protein [Pseudothermotoga thermarum]AEH51889.1 hypothetical protein Theth_1847 [Pseudothermotoga thermarum DSM 5069]